ncbi:MAG: TolC family outer membrane protein [Nitrosomonas sp.]|uniref:TolC family outer membrane protein n=1 Tax=Nitrosomonas sp. TaxID=42353 RepID=UPI0027342D57|nr:TolC family outer membrane protein [Nitrosomonas sp.]MDP3281486.1 TolC family outer membrane protein [Nitrosomonas sp.]MDP3663031.1 TolC family outer membrane protein [Nitrosomonas sp.]MDZ4107008.1 TolC family outer membrane protein [Nitrosomonas sp.]
MKFLQSVIVVFIGILWPCSLQAADLMGIYQEALTQDPQYRSARAAYQAAEEKLPQGRAGFLPNITFSATRQVQEVETSFAGTNIIQNRGLVLSATQPLFRMQNIVIYQQSKIEVSKADAQFVVAAQDLILRVAQAYFDVLDAQIDVEVAEAQKKAILIQLEQAKRNFEVGVSTIVDTNEAQARHDLVISQEIAARNALEIKKRTLQGIIDRFPENLVGAKEIAADLTNMRYSSMDEWVRVAEEKNFALKIQQAAYEIAHQDVKKVWAQHYPTVDLVAQYSDQTGVGGAITGRGIDLTSKSIGLQLNFPIFQGFSVQSQVREALALQNRALHDLENTRRNITLQIRQQYLNVTNGIAQVKALKQALISSQSQLDSTILGQQVGVRTEVDVLNVQQQLYSARRDLAKAYHSYLMSRLRLSAEAGELDEDTLTQINAMLIK